MRTQLQGGTVVGFNGPTHVLIRDSVVVCEAIGGRTSVMLKVSVMSVFLTLDVAIFSSMLA